MVFGHRNYAEEQSPSIFHRSPAIAEQSSSLAERSLSIATLPQALRSIPRRLRNAPQRLRSVPQALRNGLNDFAPFPKPLGCYPVFGECSANLEEHSKTVGECSTMFGERCKSLGERGERRYNCYPVIPAWTAGIPTAWMLASSIPP
jgi:hypothetical protein